MCEFICLCLIRKPNISPIFDSEKKHIANLTCKTTIPAWLVRLACISDNRHISTVKNLMSYNLLSCLASLQPR